MAEAVEDVYAGLITRRLLDVLGGGVLERADVLDLMATEQQLAQDLART